MTIHKSPEGVKAMLEPPCEEMMTVGAGPGMASSARRNSAERA